MPRIEDVQMKDLPEGTMAAIVIFSHSDNKRTHGGLMFKKGIDVRKAAQILTTMNMVVHEGLEQMLLNLLGCTKEEVEDDDGTN